jgi:hypothetical protein
MKAAMAGHQKVEYVEGNAQITRGLIRVVASNLRAFHCTCIQARSSVVHLLPWSSNYTILSSGKTIGKVLVFFLKDNARRKPYPKARKPWMTRAIFSASDLPSPEFVLHIQIAGNSSHKSCALVGEVCSVKAPHAFG